MRKRGPGEGAIYKRRSDGRWTGAVSVRAAEGNRRRRVIYGSTRREVAEGMKRLLRDQQQGLPMIRAKTPFGQYLVDWLTSIRHAVRPSTYVSYEAITRLHVVPRLGHLALDSVTASDVRGFVAKRLAEGASPRTVERDLVLVRQVLTRAVDDGLIAQNVARRVERPSPRRVESRVFTPQQARLFLATVSADRLSALYASALVLGLRQGEALGLRWVDIDFERSTLRVSGALRPVPPAFRGDDTKGRRLVVSDTKTSRSHRVIAMPETVATALSEHRARQALERLVAGSTWKGDEWGLIFTTTIGTPLDAANVTKQFKRHLRAAGLPSMRFHDLRHSAATLLLTLGVSPRVVMEVLGHADVRMTLGTYSHVLPSLAREAAERMDAMLTGS